MPKTADVKVRLADGKMVMDLIQSANAVVSSAVEHQAECRANGIDFCVVCANVGDMVKPLREFFRRWAKNDPPAPLKGEKLELYAGACATCDRITRRSVPEGVPEGGQVYECPKCAGGTRAGPPVKVPKEICYYCHHEATETVREHNATGIPVCADHGHGPVQAKDDGCEVCRKGPTVTIPTGGGQFVTCIPCAKALRVSLKEVIDAVETGSL